MFEVKKNRMLLRDFTLHKTEVKKIIQQDFETSERKISKGSLSLDCQFDKPSSYLYLDLY